VFNGSCRTSGTRILPILRWQRCHSKDELRSLKLSRRKGWAFWGLSLAFGISGACLLSKNMDSTSRERNLYCSTKASRRFARPPRPSKNQYVYSNSFLVNQMDMFESVLRIIGDRREDWKITKELSKRKYSDGIRELEAGNRTGFARMMYTRVFFPDGCGSYESKGLLNDLLSLPKKDMNDATKASIERSKRSSGFKYLVHVRC
jgi:hypothetical protein